MSAAIAVAGRTSIARADSDGDGAQAKKIFNQRCTACHLFGRGVKVGPDLKGIGQRRPLSWTVKFVRSSQTLIKAGDPTAKALFAQFKQQRMPDWPDLTEQQITSLVKWLADNGPEHQEPDERNAELATTADVEWARQLFHGRTPLVNRGVACVACHDIKEPDATLAIQRGGTLGPDLTDTYLRYRDRALTLFLKHPCNARAPEHDTGHYLTPTEAFALKAYLRHAAIAGGKDHAP